MKNGECVYIVDGDPSTQASMGRLIASMQVESVAFASADEFLSAFDESRGGCLVADARLPGMTGLELFEALTRPPHRIPCLMLTAFADVPLAVKAMSLGALAVFQKPYREQDIWEAINKGLTINRRCSVERERIREIEDRLLLLTADERRVLELILTGSTNKEIARELQAGLRTVEGRRHAIMFKMRAQSLVELVRTIWETHTARSHRQNFVRESALVGGGPHQPLVNY
jgi:two-component system, LuxR family, response regulator FixJ